MSELTLEHIKELKGAALSAYILLHFADTAVSQEWLICHSGYTTKTIASALEYLLQTGRAFKTASGWLATGPAEIIIAPVEIDIDDSTYDSTGRAGTGTIEKTSKRPRAAAANREKNSLSDPIIIINNTRPTQSEESNNNKNNNKNYTPNREKNSTPSAENPIWDELRRIGIYRNVRTEKMLQLPHVNMDYIRDLIDQFVEQGKGGYQWGGLFVQLCERAEKVKDHKVFSHGHKPDCDCNLCKMDQAIEYSRRNQRR